MRVKQEFEQKWQTVCNIVNMRHRVTKESQSLYCIDVESKENNQNIYDIKKLGKTIIIGKVPRKKNTIVYYMIYQKIHKNDAPLIPVVSPIGSPSYGLAKHLTRLLQPRIGLTEPFVRDSAHFLQNTSEVLVFLPR
ncbi:MAG: hypothetical protein ACEY3E_01380 [Candidatus Tisiphia sp.]